MTDRVVWLEYLETVVRDREGTTSEPCVSREEYDRTHLGAFWHGRTDG